MGEIAENAVEATAITLPNSEQFYLNNDQGQKYLIQISWPLNWKNAQTSNRGPIPIMYDLSEMKKGQYLLTSCC